VKALLTKSKEVNGMDDLHIIDLYFARNERAIKETDVSYGKLCYQIAYNILGNKEDAEECVSDTYHGLWNAIPPERPVNLTAFVCRIARNLSLKRLELLSRQKRSGAVFVSLEELAEILPDESIESSLTDKDIGKRISDFLRSEKADARNVFIRKYYFFDSVEDIARRCGFTESKVKNMLYRTRNRLKEYLIREGIQI
jgi:RNA polymerase sigma-70 factor (ECF subfamily)